MTNQEIKQNEIAWHTKCLANDLERIYTNDDSDNETFLSGLLRETASILLELGVQSVLVQSSSGRPSILDLNDLTLEGI